MISEVIFDLETKSFFDETDDHDPAGLGVSIVSVYTRKLDSTFKEIEGRMQSFWERDFDRLWPLFSDADRVIGFNSKRFDAPALKPYSPSDLSKLPHFDILEHVRAVHGKRVSLDRIAASTLGRTKIDSGANAVKYWKSQSPQDLEKLQKYCEMDVIITRDVYDHAMRERILKFVDFWNTPFTIEVDFSYPPDFTPKSTNSQTSLF